MGCQNRRVGKDRIVLLDVEPIRSSLTIRAVRVQLAVDLRDEELDHLTSRSCVDWFEVTAKQIRRADTLTNRGIHHKLEAFEPTAVDPYRAPIYTQGLLRSELA